MIRHRPDLDTDLLNGALLFLARPGYNGNRHMEAVVVNSTANSIVVEDLTGDLETVRWTGERAELCGAASASAPARGGTRYLWAGYRYQPPQMGFWVDPPGAAGLGIYGAATGTNRLGQYYCWNRTYDLNLGRWTTPDPVATPFWNLNEYASSDPTKSTDPNRLLKRYPQRFLLALGKT